MRKLLIFLAVFCLFALSFWGAQDVYLQESNRGKYQNVILIGWDGAGRNRIKESLGKGLLPVLSSLSKTGRLVAIDILRTTDSKAGWAQILTGYNPESTGVYSNSRSQRIPAGLTVFERLTRHYAGQDFTASAVIGKSITSILPEDNSAQTLAPGDYLICCLPDDDKTLAKALEIMENNKNRRFFLFVHFEELDIYGHIFGENSKSYQNALVSCDRRTGKIFAKLKELGLFDKTLIYITADHGFDVGKRSHHDAPYVFLATNDLLVIRRGNRADITPTILYRMGLRLDEIDPPLDGHTLTKPYHPGLWD